PDMLQRLNALAVTALGCDWSATFLWDDRRHAFRLQAIADPRDREWHEQLAELDLTTDVVPLLAEFRSATLVEVSDAMRDPRLPAELMRRLNIASGVSTPIRRSGAVIGFLAHGH